MLLPQTKFCEPAAAAILPMIGPHPNPRHHATTLMFENVAMINKIAGYRERNGNDSRVGFAGTLAPVRNAQQPPSAWTSGTLSMRIPLGKIWLGTFV
jgi:hypothetical protein